MNAEEINSIDLGLIDYEKAYRMQKDFVNIRKSGGPDKLLFLEHPEVYTYGRKSRFQPQLENSFYIERGGEATYHNPGQLVVYPILKLEDGERDLHHYLRRLEATVIDVLSKFELEAQQIEEATGVWIGEKKIASIGIAVSGWVTYHGIALNVSNDLKGFSKISPCGFSPDVMTSMVEELGWRPDMMQVKHEFSLAFERNFNKLLI